MSVDPERDRARDVPPPRPRLPWVESAHIERELAARALPDDVADIARRYHADGFAVLPGLVDLDLVDEIRAEMADELRGVSRVQDAWQRCDAVRRLALLPAVLTLLEQLYGRRPVPFQTLNFEYGTQQRAHSDVIHFSSLPPRFMCGVWVALEDVDHDNGPLFYYPGSHRLPDPSFQRFGLTAGYESYPSYEHAQAALVEEHGLERVELRARAGDVLIWSANLVHGGRPILAEGRTRWSQVTHYFFEGCVYVTPLLSDPDLGEWFVRDGLVDISTGEIAPMSLDGAEIHLEPLGDGRSRIHRGPRPDVTTADHVASLHRELEQARHDAAEAQQRFEALRRSAAVRVGSALTRPMTRVRRLGRGRR